MTTEQQIKMVLSYAGISQAELARRLNIKPQNLNRAIKQNALSVQDMSKIAEAIGCTWHNSFIFPDNTEI